MNEPPKTSPEVARLLGLRNTDPQQVAMEDLGCLGHVYLVYVNGMRL